ncbi:MAG: hypothetical protein ACTII7_04545 [Galactobacter sp.]
MRDEPAHDDSGQRYLYDAGVECTPGGWRRAVSLARSEHGKRLKVEALHTILSYSRDEADPDDPDAGRMVLDDARAFAERAYSGHASLVVVQQDGRAGLWHAHVATANVGHGPSRLYDGTVRPAGYALHESQRHVFTSRNMLDEVLLDRRGFDNEAHMKAHAGSDHMIPSDERRRDEGRYVWRDDLKERIDEHAAAASDFEDFKERMAADGVVVTEKHAQKRGLAYEFAGQDGKPHRARAGGRQGLGTAYGYEEIVARLGRPVAAPQSDEEQDPPQQAAPEPEAEQEEVPRPAPAFRALAPEPEPVVEEPAAVPEPDLDAEELARRQRVVRGHERALREHKEQLAQYDRIATRREREQRRLKYLQQQRQFILHRLFLESLRPAAADLALPWPEQPSREQMKEADDIAGQLVQKWAEYLLEPASSVKRPSAGRKDWQAPKPPQ